MGSIGDPALVEREMGVHPELLVWGKIGDLAMLGKGRKEKNGRAHRTPGGGELGDPNMGGGVNTKPLLSGKEDMEGSGNRGSGMGGGKNGGTQRS